VSRPPDPVLKNSFREFVQIMLAWAASTAYTCIYCHLYGYRREGHMPGVEEIDPILGVPSWVFWGVLAPWAVCTVFTIWFAGFHMTDDDLGKDHAKELEADIRGGGLDE
jgi:hypothetical protein